MSLHYYTLDTSDNNIQSTYKSEGDNIIQHHQEGDIIVNILQTTYKPRKKTRNFQSFISPTDIQLYNMIDSFIINSDDWGIIKKYISLLYTIRNKHFRFDIITKPSYTQLKNCPNKSILIDQLARDQINIHKFHNMFRRTDIDYLYPNIYREYFALASLATTCPSLSSAPLISTSNTCNSKYMTNAYNSKNISKFLYLEKLKIKYDKEVELRAYFENNIEKYIPLAITDLVLLLKSYILLL